MTRILFERMVSMKYLLLVAAIVPALLALTCIENKSAAEEPGTQAPPFTLKDPYGRKVSLHDFKGQVVIIDFWATWCHVCEDTSPELERIYNKFKNRGLVLLGISLDEGERGIEDVKNFTNKFNLTYTILMDDGKANRLYKIIGIPTTYILDQKHIIIEKYVGSVFGFEDKITHVLEKLYKTKQ